jgi:DNA mismatch endonuclease, patch repair protein
MVDVVDRKTRSRMMSGIRGKDTKPELFLRSSVHKMGYRYVLGGRKLPGKPDLVFPSRRIVVFVHGCFWHRHRCKYFKWPSSNYEFWRDKIEGNVRRDRRTEVALRKSGWKIIVIWECELKETHYCLPNASITRLAEELADYKVSYEEN